MPKFSIAIPAYNRLNYLRQALASALAQTLTDFEVVVSDDCSSEDLGKLVSSFGDSRLLYSRSPENLGAVRNHQRAVGLCRGEFVQILHSDDLLMPKCLEEAGEALNQYPGAAAAYFSLAALEKERITGCHPMPEERFVTIDSPEEARRWEKFGGVAPSSCLFRRAAFEAIGGFRVNLSLAYDWDIYMRFLGQGGGVVFLPRVLGIYRRHEEQSIQVRSLDGLRDVLQLWGTAEYRHWSNREIAEIAWNELRMQGRSGRDVWTSVIGELHRYRVSRRVVAQWPGLWMRRRFMLDGPPCSGERVKAVRLPREGEQLAACQEWASCIRARYSLAI